MRDMYRSNYWSVRVTHLPTGLQVTRTNEHFRNQHHAKEACLKYLKSRLYMLGKEYEDCDVQYELPDEGDDMHHPKELGDYSK